MGRVVPAGRRKQSAVSRRSSAEDRSGKTRSSTGKSIRLRLHLVLDGDAIEGIGATVTEARERARYDYMETMRLGYGKYRVYSKQERERITRESEDPGPHTWIDGPIDIRPMGIFFWSKNLEHVVMDVTGSRSALAALIATLDKDRPVRWGRKRLKEILAAGGGKERIKRRAH